MDSFVYRWRERATNKWYIGYHKGTADDGYICSSDTVLPMIQSNPTGWTRKILRTGTRKEMVALEHRLLRRLQAKTNSQSYNRSNGGQDCAVSLRDFLGYDLNQMTATEIMKRYKEEIDGSDLMRRIKVEKWIFQRVSSDRKTQRV